MNSRFSTPVRIASLAHALLAVLLHSTGAAEPIDGFLAPFATVDVATAETGIIREILVRAGERVEAGQLLVKIDDEVQAAHLALAERATRSQGRLSAAQAEVRMRRHRLEKITELIARGSARQEEFDRAAADAEVAEGQLAAIEEDLELKRLDFERARVQLRRRSIFAPQGGVVLRLHKEVGEFVGPSDPQLITVVQLDPLLAVFAVPSRIARKLEQHQEVEVMVAGSRRAISGQIEFISPVIDGRSGTKRVEIRLDNVDNRLQSGDPCSLIWRSSAAAGGDQLESPAGGRGGIPDE